MKTKPKLSRHARLLQRVYKAQRYTSQLYDSEKASMNTDKNLN